MRFVLLLFIVFLTCGCSEGTKANPLPRAPIAEQPSKVEKVVGGKTLYERLGREEGLIQVADKLVQKLDEQPASKALAARLKKRAVVDFMMEVLRNPRPGLADDLKLMPADWTLLRPALSETLTAQGLSDADRDAFLANIEKSR